MKPISVFFGLIFSVMVSFAQTSHIYFNRIDAENHLPGTNISSILEDGLGFIWIGTENGLVRYDGYRYKVYDLGSIKHNKLPVTDVVNMVCSKDSSVWVSTSYNGLFHYIRSSDSFEQFNYPEKETPTMRFMITTIDEKGDLWGSRWVDRQTIPARFNTKTKTFETFRFSAKGKNQINATQLYGINKTMDGNIWVSTDNGIYKYLGAGKGFKGYLTSGDGSKQRGVNPFYEPPSTPGMFWLNTFHGNKDFKLIRFDVRKGTVKEFKPSKNKDSLLSAGINNIYESKNKQLWFSTDSGLSRLDRRSNKFQNFVPADKVPGLAGDRQNSLSDFAEDNRGCFWLNYQYGLIYFEPATGKFTRNVGHKLHADGNDLDLYTAKIIDRSGILWMGSEGMGLFKQGKAKGFYSFINNATVQKTGVTSNFKKIVPLKNGFSLVSKATGIYLWKNGVNSFEPVYIAKNDLYTIDYIFGKDSALYIVTVHGLLRYAIKKHDLEVIFTNDNVLLKSLNNPVFVPPVTCLLQDHSGTIWYGTFGGQLAQYNPATKKTIKNVLPVASIKSMESAPIGTECSVYSIFEDRQHIIWLGADCGGLYRFDRKTRHLIGYNKGNNQRIFMVHTFFEDRAGNFWLGTESSGLFLFDRQKGTCKLQFNKQNGLANFIKSISEDASGALWLTTEQGLSRLDVATMRIKNFSAKDLIPGNEELHIRSTTLIDKRLVFVCDSGLIITEPHNLENNPVSPLVHIESIVVGNPASPDTSQKTVLTFGRRILELPYNQNKLQFNYVGLHYEEPLQNTYAYRLDGYDTKWIQAGSVRSATYTNLSPGTYVFSVRAANSSGVWNYNGASFTVIITAPWWLRWWAWLIYLIVIAGGIYLFIEYRARQLRRENKALEIKISERTKALSQANNELSEQQEEIVTQRDKLAETITDLKATQNQLIHAEKMASLGELTAGIAHEIQNPLNFVNNFSDVNQEMLAELKEELKTGNVMEALAIADDIKQNEDKINHHGKRADSIVKAMLEHSRIGSGAKEPTDINKLADEYFRLSYHGLRAKNKTFNAELVTHFSEQMPPINVIPREIGRVLLNLFNNAFYATQQRTTGENYKPLVEVTTIFLPGKGCRISIKDNGAGIPDDLKDKIMQPFFTTKPTGEGTGLGLSLSYDVIVQGHNGTIDFDSTPGQGSEFKITLPL